MPPREVKNDPPHTPLTTSISTVLLDIDALPSPPSSSAIVTTEPLERTSPLAERALRSQRRDALRATRHVAELTSPSDTVRSNAILEKIVLAQIPEIYRSTLPFTPQRHAPVYEYRIPATTPRVTKTLAANQPPFTTGPICPARDFSPLVPLRASRSMSSPTISTFKTLNKTASPSLSASRPPLDTSPVPSTNISGSSGSETGRTCGLRPAAPLPRDFHATTYGPPSTYGTWHPSGTAWIPRCRSR